MAGREPTKDRKLITEVLTGAIASEAVGNRKGGQGRSYGYVPRVMATRRPSEATNNRDSAIIVDSCQQNRAVAGFNKQTRCSDASLDAESLAATRGDVGAAAGRARPDGQRTLGMVEG
ncbi:MAG: hypothetical protein M3Q10_20440 [Chloroflexota bacterium]|nr:hypothetical protein [Chloroflexota bacterium]